MTNILPINSYHFNFVLQLIWLQLYLHIQVKKYKFVVLFENTIVWQSGCGCCQTNLKITKRMIFIYILSKVTWFSRLISIQIQLLNHDLHELKSDSNWKKCYIYEAVNEMNDLWKGNKKKYKVFCKHQTGHMHFEKKSGLPCFESEATYNSLGKQMIWLELIWPFVLMRVS